MMDCTASVNCTVDGLHGMIPDFITLAGLNLNMAVAGFMLGAGNLQDGCGVCDLLIKGHR